VSAGERAGDGRLAGKVALITGAARGQGACHARLFAAEGARVMLTDVLEKELRAVATDLGDAARCMRHDVASESDWAGTIAATLAAFGHLDVLVNNAAIHHAVPIERESRVDFERILAVNLTGTFLGIRSAIAPMRERGRGSIVNISSLAGMQGFFGHAAYGAAKWGVRGLTKTAAVELGPLGIRVNSVHPGPIDTDMLPRGSGNDPDRFKDMPLSRIGRPEEVAALVLFLASDESSYVTGAEVTIDGGMDAGRVPPRSGA
jgi:3alpha(or 20beta)-hydroxysteroid dehydrogenase